MISRDRFNNVKEGDFLVFKSGRVRKVTKVSQCWLPRVQLKPRTYLYFEKVLGRGHTIMAFGQCSKEVTGIFTPKS
jgi:hypothetical protein